MQKKVIVVTGSLEIGGTERHLSMVLPLLAAKGWTVQVVVLAKKGALAPVLEEQGVPVISLLKPSHLKAIEKLPKLLGRALRVLLCILLLAKKLKKEGDTIVHFFLPEAYLIGMFGARLAGFRGPKLMSRRSLNNYQKRRPGVAWFERKLHSKVTVIIGNSAAILKQLVEEERVSPSRLKLIYNGINLEKFSQTKSPKEARKLLSIPHDALVMIIVANLIPYKGHHDLLKALYAVKNDFPSSWYLICVGRDDGIGSSLKQIADQMGLSKHILWLGSRTDVPDLLAMSNIGILCSHEEGFSNAILESMAAGLPMVVTDVGGNKEAILNDQIGYVVESQNPPSLGQAILKLVKNPKKAEAFGHLARLRVKEHFSIEACVSAYADLYGGCLTNRARQP